MSTSLPSIDGFERALDEVKSHAHAVQLSALCFDVLSRQAEGRALYSGRKLMRARASTHRVNRSSADTTFGNLLAMLERGPERSSEWLLIAGFGVRGLEDKLNESDAAEKRELAARFARHADWLELSTPYALYAFVPLLLSEGSQDALVEALEGVVLAPVERAQLPAYRARAMLRIHVLASLQRPAARVALARVVEGVQDDLVRAVALRVLGDGPAPLAEEAAPVTDGFELKGVWGQVPRLSFARVLSYFAGIPLLVGLSRLIAFGLGLENSARVRLEHEAVHVRRETFLFGRLLRITEATYALRDLECATREVSMPLFQVLFGAGALAVGSLLSVIWLSQAVARGDRTLLGSAIVALCVGVGIDLLFAGWGRLRTDRAGFEMFVDGQRVVALRRVNSLRAQRLVEQIARRRA
jgi:hypothetical protein